MMPHALDGFRRQTPAERRAALGARGWLSAAEVVALGTEAGLDDDAADVMIENVVGVYGLPLGIALNFRLNGEERLVPMAVEEPSVVAAASNAARMVAAGGGFRAVADPPLMAAQIQLLDVADPGRARARHRRRARASCSPPPTRSSPRSLPAAAARATWRCESSLPA